VATKRCCTFPTSGHNVVVTGTPLRAEIERVDRSSAARLLAKRHATPPIDADRFVVVVMTGSLGAASVNTAVRDLAALWSTRGDLTIIHVTGRRDYVSLSRFIPELAGLDYRVVEFGDMVTLWGLCDLAICRAGATTLAELTALAIPSILVPLPNAPDDHQTKNARALVAAGGAELVIDDDCTASTLATTLTPLLDHATLAVMSRRAGALAHRDAAHSIASVILRVRGR
jgi:UDP-N-acetylglucosamine--N-acetylmuramyl-(pentapeptide) pyrophosphoryl-undecaprenol N-acetylglucosamine transferase